jgi:cysteine desulfurase family protein (TIGR01976 family)
MFSIDFVRSQFPALARRHRDRPLVYLDGPAGTQVPQSVADRVSEVLLHHSANRSGRFVTSREVDTIMEQAHTAAADLLQAHDPRSIAFGPNMTSLTFQLSRALAREWGPGDEILVSKLDHDANFTPWVLAARDAGATLRTIELQTADATLCMQSLREQLSPKTKLVAVTAASNAVGSLTDVPAIAQLVHRVGAELFIDAVHYAPHRRIDVNAWDCDYLVCSAYKFFGPHIGLLYGRPDRMQSLVPYKLRPAPDAIPGRWMTGTQNHACIAGVTAAIDYMADLSGLDRTTHTRRARLDDAFSMIVAVETERIARLIAGLYSMPHVKLYGITQPDRMHERAPTVAFRIEGLDSLAVATRLGEQGICAWHGNYYALPLTMALGTEPAGMVRLGCMHYNTDAEIDQTLDAIHGMRPDSVGR